MPYEGVAANTILMTVGIVGQFVAGGEAKLISVGLHGVKLHLVFANHHVKFLGDE